VSNDRFIFKLHSSSARGCAVCEKRRRERGEVREEERRDEEGRGG
jgi:hypothetical protein